MKPSPQVTMFATSMLIVCMAGSMLLLHQVDQARDKATLQETLYISSPKVLKRLSLGYEGLLADIYWTRAVQYFGGHHANKIGEYDLLAPLLNITTALDPQLMPAYEFGSNFLSPRPPDGAGKPKEAIDLVEFGIRHNPDNWRLYFNLGFIYYTELQDPAKAADVFQRGSQLPNAHPWLKILAAQMASTAGDSKTARMMWSATYDTTTDKMVRSNASAHLKALKVDDDISMLDNIIARYQLTAGHPPASFGDMIRAGLLPGVPVDPLGNPYVLTGDGRIEVSDPDNLPFIKFGKPMGYKAPAGPKLPTD
jgi:tetratricopeptide (TPR) repeat protein